MEMTSPCHICGKPATQSCSICGSITCDKHIEKGVCRECKEGRSGGDDPRTNLSSKDVYS